MDGNDGSGPASIFNDTNIKLRETLTVSPRQGPITPFPGRTVGLPAGAAEIQPQQDLKGKSRKTTEASNTGSPAWHSVMT